MSTHELALKYDLLNSQMNPHFINNAIQSICNSITKGNVAQSINWLNRLSHLYRLVQKSTKTKLITLQEELEISKLYIELQKDLFNGGFSYTIQINKVLKDDLAYTKVPPLILQPLIENAILHGLKGRTKKGTGKLKIKITIIDEMLCVCIKDNGSGISHSNVLSEASGISLENINERLKIINGDEDECNELLKVENIITENGEITGTKSCVKIPLIQL